MRRFLTLLKQNRSLILFISLMLVFRSAVADWNSVPTGSMKPTIVEGDRLLVNKMAYDLRIPFTHISIAKLADPQRGDIVIFDSKASNKKLVKRVIGLPTDTIVMRDNVLSINGEVLQYSDASEPKLDNSDIRVEHLLGLSHQVKIAGMSGQGVITRQSSFGPITVPEGHYLVLGDNREHSADSRMIGFVPRAEIVGRSKTVVFSANYDNYYLPRPERFFHSL
ncbi:signal peptidase I [Shewanella sp. Choline-02u-19]|uniref:signal peptidase I n=1 Tax=unclassified Shewanella TaxID=196818 RepID=UPI000C34810A|nr:MULTISPECIES: signal peptidase I [unclassified Shewanella]PKG56907.1 signal peptidase I [Shewanella sp. GutDb-MelDb]PKH57776.1 signal peptidase I [Shewanella sp. Bg11-22]PKI29805.1 signal peptidase I [Shewanella sp. Choline-02u-19]